MSTKEINDRVVNALFSKGVGEAYKAIPYIVQSLYGLIEREDDERPDTLVRLLSGMGLDTAEKIASFVTGDGSLDGADLVTITYRSDRPQPGELVCVEWGDGNIIPADVWLYQVGDHWKATVHPEIDTWWEGSDTEDLRSAPPNWVRHIADVPETGTLDWVHTSRPYDALRAGAAHLSRLAISL